MATKPTRSLRRAAIRRRNCLVAALLLSSVIPRAKGQYIDLWQAQQQAESARWLPTPKFIDMDVEAEKDTYSASIVGQPLERLFLQPSIGIQWDNYFYHPYLLTYSALFEPGYLIRFEGPPNAIRRTDELLLDGKFIANFLSIKPYATTFTYDRNFGQVNYDIFNSALVDSQSYGMATGYREGPIPVTLTFQQTHEDSSSFNQTATTDQTTLDLHGRNERSRDDVTDFSYQYGQFNRDLFTGGQEFPSDTSYHHASISDNEQFENSNLRSTAFLFQTDTGGASSINLNGNENFNWNITPSLLNYDNYAFSYFSGDGAESFQHFGTAGIQHHLYDSLVSSLEGRGSYLESRTDGSSLDLLSGGLTGTLTYTKLLGDWGRLILGDSASYTGNKQNASGSITQIPNESHVIPLNGLVRLNQPRNLILNSVTDINGVPLIPGSDYNLIATTDPWQLQILFTGPSRLTVGQTILVTYTIESNPSGTYSSVGNQAVITLRFWKDRASVFGHYYVNNNNASSPDFVLDNVHEVLAGAELNWLGAVLHGDWTDHRSTIYSYYGFSFLESYSAVMDSQSTVGIDLAQQFLTYPPTSLTPGNETEHLTYYSFMLRHEWRPTFHLTFNNQLGYIVQRGLGFDQKLLSGRSYMRWQMGKAEVDLGYEYTGQTIITGKIVRNYAFLRMRRNF